MPGEASWNHSDDSRRLVDPVVRALLGVDIGAWDSVYQRRFFDLAISRMTKEHKKSGNQTTLPAKPRNAVHDSRPFLLRKSMLP